MSYEKREKNRRKRKLFRVLIISFIFLYLIFRSVPSLLAHNAKTVLPEKGTLIEKLSTQGYTIMNETVIKATGNGEIEKNSTEGVRIAAGIQVASINSLNDTSSLKQELSQIEKSIEALKKSEAETKLVINEKTKIEDLRESLISELQNTIIQGKFDEVYILKDQLSLYDDKVRDLSFSNTLVGQSLENLKSRKENINAEINSNHIKYYADHGGIISYAVDGYEETYLPKDFENYTYDKLTSGKLLNNHEEKSSISVDEPIFKIIDNFEWYIAVKIEDIKEIEDFKVNQTIVIEFKKKEQELKGKIVAINLSEKKGVIVIKLNTMLHDYYNIRFPEVEVIKYKKDGYKIPTKSIVDKDSIKGVYIKDKSGIVKFRPVIIMGEDSNYTYVDMGDSNANIQIEGQEKLLKTITLFDEIFLNTVNIKEGQILN